MFSGRTISDVLTKTTWQGFNPLGLLFVLAWAAAMIAVVNLLNGQRLMMRQVAIGIAGLSLAIVDLIWRFRAPPRDSIWRFGSEFAGGSMMWIPAWTWMFFVSIIAAMYWVGE